MERISDVVPPIPVSPPHAGARKMVGLERKDPSPTEGTELKPSTMPPSSSPQLGGNTPRIDNSGPASPRAPFQSQAPF